MSAIALEMLFDAVADYRADYEMTRKKPGPVVQIEYDSRGVGLHAFTVRVEGQEIAHHQGTSVESAAKRCRERFQLWADDQAEHLEHALEVSIREARTAGGPR